MSFGEGNLRTAVAELQARIDELEREREFQKKLDSEAMAFMRGKVDKLQADNEQLRQLVRDLHVDFRGLADTIFMNRNRSMTINGEQAAHLKTLEMSYRLRAKDLGIEVEQ